MENLAQLSEQSIARLEQLESHWLEGQIPDVASYLSQSLRDDPRACRDLVELDMEYRWRRYQHGTSESDLDPFGFPQYPRLEHYAELLDESLRPHLLNPELLAEEYRVRTFWGDRPDHRQFLDRLPEESGSIELALDLMDAELEIEGMSARYVDRSSEETTQLFDQRSGELEETIPDSDVPARIGKYRLQELLGRGGFGEVWKAYDPDLNRSVALKFPNPRRELSRELYQGFRREAENMASLERVSGVVPIYEVGEDQGVPYIAASFIDGEDLSVRQKENPLSYEEAARITADVAETLHRAHLKDLFHRDVKLSNILIDKNGQVFLSDFGLCVSEQEQLHEGHSATGTYAYMAPEQIYGDSHRVDGRADIYALGVVLYRLLTGRLPFIGNTSVEYMEQTLKKAPRPPRSIDDKIPEELERISLKCLNKKTEDRYTTAGDLARDLRNWLRSREPCAVADVAKVGTLPQRTFRERHTFLIKLAVLLIAVGGLFVLWDSNRGSKERELGQLDVVPGKFPSKFPTVNEINGTELTLWNTNPAALSPEVEKLKYPSWIIKDDGHAVEVYKNHSLYCMASLGVIEKEQELSLQVDLIGLKPGSRAGIFFGMNEPGEISRYPHWQSILIERKKDGSLRLLRDYFEHKNDLPYHYQFNPVPLNIAILNRNAVRISVVISSERLEHLEVNGHKYDELVKQHNTDFPLQVRTDRGSPTWNFHGTGLFGLTCMTDEVFFANLVINGQPFKFKNAE